jgi:hypothetical protein
MTYLNIEELASGTERLASTYPDLVDLIRLPNASVEGRDIRALALGDARGNGLRASGSRPTRCST